MALKIILSSGSHPLRKAMQSLAKALPPAPAELYCLCADKAEIKESERHFNEEGPAFAAFEFHGPDSFTSPESLANHLFKDKADSEDLILFISAKATLEKGAIGLMGSYLAADNQAAGVSPLLSAAWAEGRAAFMGLAFDYQKKLHFLYEGVLIDGPLARKERRFQLGHPDALLIRAKDFARAGGFNESLGSLAFPSLCISILKFRPGGFACLPKARGMMLDRLNSWDLCGLWNSVLLRGRLDASGIRADYPEFCKADDLEYGCDAWLNEGPALILDPSDSEPVRRWQEWRAQPNPAALMAYITSLPEELRAAALALARNRPSSLPQTLRYYQVQAEKILQAAGSSNPALAASVQAWRKRSRSFHYKELKGGIGLLKTAGLYNCSLDSCPAVYDAWIESAEKAPRLEISQSWPEIAVVMPVWNPKPDFLRQAIESVLGQSYPKWSLCIADDASDNPEIRPLLESFAKSDKRVRLIFREENGHICRATNSALGLVIEPYAAFMDHDDLLAESALAEAASLLAQSPGLGFIYTDEDNIDERNVRRSPKFKPDFDRDLFYTGHLSVYDTCILRHLGGLRSGLEGTQDGDLCMRAAELLDESQIAHIPKVLYHWRVHEQSTAGSLAAKPYVVEATRKAFLEAAARSGRDAYWSPEKRFKFFKLLYRPPKDLVCSVVLLTGGESPSPALLGAIKELNGHVETRLFSQGLRADVPGLSGFIHLPFAGKNMSRAMNSAAESAGGDIILFLSAELEPHGECRLEQLVEMARLPHIAMAGANIWLGGRLFNGGFYPNADGAAFPLLRGFTQSEIENCDWGRMLMPRHALGASWHCLALNRSFLGNETFLKEELGLMAPVEFSLRAMRRGKFTAINPWVNWRLPDPPRPPDKAEMKLLYDQCGPEIAACGIRNANLKAAPDGDWTLIL